MGHVALVRGSWLNDQERLRVALAELADLHRTKHVAEEFVALIDEWAPLCLVLGVMVRNCNWGNRTMGSGERAREVVLTALLALLYLTEGAEHRAQYVRQMCIVLVTWSRWHDYVPGCLYTKKANEGSLSPLGALCRSHRRLRTLADVMDLFRMVLLLPAGSHDRPQPSTHPPAAADRAGQPVAAGWGRPDSRAVRPFAGGVRIRESGAVAGGPRAPYRIGPRGTIWWT